MLSIDLQAVRSDVSVSIVVHLIYLSLGLGIKLLFLDYTSQELCIGVVLLLRVDVYSSFV